MGDFGEQRGPGEGDLGINRQPQSDLSERGKETAADRAFTNVIIVRSPEDLELYRKAAKGAGGTFIEELKGDEAVSAFLAARDPSLYPGRDLEKNAREALSTGATMIGVTEDPDYPRPEHVEDFYEQYRMWKKQSGNR